MTVAYDSLGGTIRTGTGSPTTWTHTPSGTPRAVMVAVIHGISTTDHCTAVSYGGVPLSRVIRATDAAGEPGAAEWWLLGSGIPTGAQTVSATCGSTTDDIALLSIAMTAAADTQVLVSDKVEGDASNPQLTLARGGVSGLGITAIYSGHNAPSSLTNLSGNSDVDEGDLGAFCYKINRQTTAGTADVAQGWTATSEDVALVAMVISEVTGQTVSPGALDSGIAVAALSRIDQTVSPAAIALAVTNPAPSVAQLITPGPLALNVIASAPSRFDQDARPGAVPLAVAAAAPSIASIVDPAAIALLLAPQSPLRIDQTASGGAIALAVATVAPRVDQEARPAAVTLAVATVVPRLDIEARPAAINLALAASAPRADQETRISALGLTLAPVTPSRLDLAVTPAAIALSLADPAPLVELAGLLTVSPDPIGLALAAQSPTRIDQAANPGSIGLTLGAPSPRVDLALATGAIGLILSPVAFSRIDLSAIPPTIDLLLVPQLPRLDHVMAPDAIALVLGIVVPRLDHLMNPAAIDLLVAVVVPSIEGGGIVLVGIMRASSVRRMGAGATADPDADARMGPGGVSWPRSRRMTPH